MIKYTTPAINLKVNGINLAIGYDVYITFEQACTKLTKTDWVLTPGMDESGVYTMITVVLTQEETAMFDFDKSCLIQVNYIDSNNVRGATDISGVPVMRNLLDKVVQYGE